MIAIPEPWRSQFLRSDDERKLSDWYASVESIDPKDLSPDQWAGRLADLRPDAILTGWGTPAIPAQALPQLKLLAHAGGGVRHLVTRDMIENGLLVTNWGPLAAPSVAECALLLILASLRNVTYWAQTLHGGGWSTPQSPDSKGLFGRKVGIHGFGAIARSLVQMLRPFNCKISAYSAGVPQTVFQEAGVEPAASLEALFRNAEIIVEAEALTAATRHSVTEALLRSLPRGASFINVGRGAVVDEAALGRVAVDGHLQLGLDVYAVEPLPIDSPLRGLPNVTLLPHIGGPTPDRSPECGAQAVQNLIQFANGQAIANLITPEIFDRST